MIVFLKNVKFHFCLKEMYHQFQKKYSITHLLQIIGMSREELLVKNGCGDSLA